MREICQSELLELLDERLKNAPIRLAIEGRSASGKTTLARLLEERYDATVLHMDDFFLQPHQRTDARLREPGGNVDRERFLEEVLLPLSTEKPIEYRRFDCRAKTIEPPICLFPKRLTVIEGAYSMHPALEFSKETRKQPTGFSANGSRLNSGTLNKPMQKIAVIWY